MVSILCFYPKTKPMLPAAGSIDNHRLDTTVEELTAARAAGRKRGREEADRRDLKRVREGGSAL